MMESIRSKEREEEDRGIQILVNTPALQFYNSKFNHVHGGVADKRRGGGRDCGFKSKIPPVGYVCRRCKEEGHFIQHCPTNGDPTYDLKTVKPPTGIPKSMLVGNPDGVYVTPLGQACLQPNEADFEKLVEALPSKSKKRDFDFPPELYCPLCKKVMKDAVLTGKCCFKSFCDGCIRDRLMASRSECECGAKDMLADYLIPNMTVRRTIDRILESGSVSVTNSTTRSCLSFQFQFQDTGSSANSRLLGHKICNEEQKASSAVDLDARANASKKARTTTKSAADESSSEVTSGLVGVEEEEKPMAVLQESVRRGDGKGPVQQEKQVSSSGDDPIAKKKRKRENVDAESYNNNNVMMPAAAAAAAANHCAYNPYWNGMWTGNNANPYWNGMWTGNNAAAGGLGYGFGQLGIPPYQNRYPYPHGGE